MSITSKFEIDVAKTNQIDEAVGFAIKNNCPAIVVPSELVMALTINRGIKAGNFKIICAVDWPKGQQRGTEKFTGLDAEAMSANGFEILLTPGTKSQINGELQYLANFVENFFSANSIELRFVLGCGLDDRDPKFISDVMEILKGMRQPAMIRTTPLTKIPAGKATVDIHKELFSSIKKNTSKPIKISGNISSKIVANCGADFYAVTPKQAVNIISDLKDIKEIGGK
jgi:hypothetical protein